jgi:nucleoside-diphosphate-sugar epimerase
MRGIIGFTGADGFIGAHTCRYLSSLGYLVRGLLGPPGSAQLDSGDLAHAACFDIVDVDRLADLFRGVDAVVHVAGLPSVRASFDEPLEFARIHVEGTAAALEAARRSKVKRFVYMSSAEVYGRVKEDAVTENHTLEARSPYGAAKIGAEQMVRAFSHAYGLDGFVLRPFSVYGPRMGQYSLVARILDQLDARSPIRVADLRPIRDYCFVGDVARAIERAIVSPIVGVEAINIGFGVGTSVAELAKIALDLVGDCRSVCEDDEHDRPGDSEIPRLVADIGKAKERLEWVPLVDLAAGLRQTIGIVTKT